MQLILREDVASLGRAGDLVTVKAGYGRNYLVPRGLAVIATDRSVRRVEHEKRVIAKREAKRSQEAEAIKGRIEGISINIVKRTGEDDKVFGSVTAREIAAALADQGIEIDRKRLTLPGPIKTLGVHPITVRLAKEISAELKVWVVAAD